MTADGAPVPTVFHPGARVESVTGLARAAKFFGFALLGCLVLALVSPSPAEGATITHDYTGTITDVELFVGTPGPQAGSTLGQTFHLSYSFDDATVDTNPSSTVGEYDGAITSLTVRIDSYTWSITSFLRSTINVYNNDLTKNDEY